MCRISNILFTKDFNGIVLLNKILGINKIDEGKDFVKIRVGSGEDWDKFVSYCVDNNYYGIENLSLIPGSVGAAPIQNIGAYGVEIKDFIDNGSQIKVNIPFPMINRRIKGVLMPNKNGDSNICLANEKFN